MEKQRRVLSIKVERERLSEEAAVAYDVYCNLPDPEKVVINGYLQCFMEGLRGCGATSAFELWAKLAYWMAKRASIAELLHPEIATEPDTLNGMVNRWVRRYA